MSVLHEVPRETSNVTSSMVSVRHMVNRLLLASLILLLADAAYWFLADFGSFAPPSEGEFLERAFFFGLTATGPFAMAINGHFVGLAVGLPVLCGLVVAFVAVAVVGRRRRGARFLGYLGVFLWFFFGLGVATLRVT